MLSRLLIFLFISWSMADVSINHFICHIQNIMPLCYVKETNNWSNLKFNYVVTWYFLWLIHFLVVFTDINVTERLSPTVQCMSFWFDTLILILHTYIDMSVNNWQMMLKSNCMSWWELWRHLPNTVLSRVNWSEWRTRK